MSLGSRKERRTFTLDRELVGYVKKVAKERSNPSLSSALEELLRESRRRRERRQIQNAMAAYYDSLGEDDRAEQRRWGAFAESQFPKAK
jgi:hypothetical protein